MAAPTRPGYWMYETGPELRPAVRAYLAGRVLTEAQITVMRAYLRQWIMAPGWMGEGVAALRRDVDALRSRRAIKRWLDDASELNIDPL